MTLRKRATLIIIGVLIFIVLAPSALLIARGYRFDQNKWTLVKTGTLSVKTEPKGALVFLDEKKIKKTPLVKRFILPGEYTLRIEKENYFPWTKRISINTQLVTNIPSSGNEKISLLRKDPIISEIAKSITSTYQTGDQIYFANDHSIISYSPKNNATSTVALFIPDKKIDEIIDVFENNFIVKSSGVIYYISNNVSERIPGQYLNTRLDPTNPEAILALSREKNITRYYPKTSKLEIIQKNIDAYSIAGTDLYFIIKSPIPTLFQFSLITNHLNKLSEIPQFNNLEIIINSKKQIYLLADSRLYTVSESLETINTSVTRASWSITEDSLIYGNDHEIWVHKTSGNGTNQLITRSAEQINYSAYNDELEYIFIWQDKKIKAIEYEPKAEPNIYTIKESSGAGEKLYISENGENLIFTTSGNLYSAKIR